VKICFSTTTFKGFTTNPEQCVTMRIDVNGRIALYYGLFYYMKFTIRF